MSNALDVQGWIPKPPEADRPVYFIKLARAKSELAESGIRPETALFVTTADLAVIGGKIVEQPSTCEVTGINAAHLLALGTHRLATPEEIDAYRTAQRGREQALRAEADMRGNMSNLKVTTAYQEAARKLGVAGEK